VRHLKPLNFSMITKWAILQKITTKTLFLLLGSASIVWCKCTLVWHSSQEIRKDKIALICLRVKSSYIYLLSTLADILRLKTSCGSVSGFSSWTQSTRRLYFLFSPIICNEWPHALDRNIKWLLCQSGAFVNAVFTGRLLGVL